MNANWNISSETILVTQTRDQWRRIHAEICIYRDAANDPIRKHLMSSMLSKIAGDIRKKVRDKIIIRFQGAEALMFSELENFAMVVKLDLFD